MIPRSLLLRSFAFLFLAVSATSAFSQTLYDAARPELGATAKGTNSNFNRDWPAGRALGVVRGSGTIFSPFDGATIDVRLVIPVPIAAVEITGLDYNGTRQVSGVDVFIDDKKITSAALPDAPGQPTRIAITGSPVSQHVRLVATGGHPVRTLKNGKPGPDWGGFAKISVLTPRDLSEQLKAVDNYVVAGSPDFIAATTQSRAKPQVTVFGEPRQAQGHPRTLWDKQDVQQFRAMLKTSPLLAAQYAALKKAMDERIALPIELPKPVQGSDGKWTHLPENPNGRTHNEFSLHISNLATIYALSGEEKYADYARRLLLAYADNFDKYAPGNRPGFSHDQGILFDQRLSDATWLIPVARGYDLIYNAPSITPENRRHIEDDFLKASARFIAANKHVLRAPTNWSAICTTAVLITGYATDDNELIQLAMYGPDGTAEKPNGGVLLHFSDKTIGSDGLWSEGAIGYQFMAMQSVIADAEILWRNGIDMYRYRDGALKKLFDSPIAYAYPDLKTPAANDSGSISIVGRESYLYEYGYLRYRDPRYLLVLDNPGATPRLDVRFQQFPVSVIFDSRDESRQPPVEWRSENFNDVGYGILRNTSANGTVSLMLDYGPFRSHGHPDKLNLDLWTTKTGVLAPDPGIVWYEQPLYRNWYRTTMAHNALVVDEQEQVPSGGNLLVYGFGDTLAMQRANALEAAPGVVQDRAVFVTADYVADLFGAFARLPRRFDLAWHLLGSCSTDLPLEPAELPKPREPGYSELADTRSARVSTSWQAGFQVKDTPVRFHAAANGDTEVITGDGWFGRERPKTILQRRETNQTVYGTLIDVSGAAEPVVKSTSLDGSLEKGRAVLTVTTARGEDQCFVAYRPANYSVGGLETDALQAFVRREGGRTIGLMLGGGRTLKVADARLALSAPGIAALEQADTGAYVLSNLSEIPLQVSLDFAPLRSTEAWPLDVTGKRTGPATRFSPTVSLAAGQKIEFAEPGQPGIYESRTAMLRQRQAEQAAALKAERDAAAARSQERAREAAAKPTPAGTSVVAQAEDFTAQGDGKVNIATNKTGQIGKSFAGWNDEGHWLEWKIEVPAEGYYHVSLVYCTQVNNAEREIRVNGVAQEPYAPFRLPTTGGYSNGTDDWRLFTAQDPITEAPLLVKFKAGQNTLRLTNSNGLAANLDYLVVTSPDVQPQRLSPPIK
jgi:hypothetical protein